MATASRGTNPPVEKRLEKHPLVEEGYRFDFFQAVRMLERLCPQRQPVGGTSPPQDEAVRFRVRQTLSFPPSAIHEVAAAENGADPPQMTVAFFGLTGPLGVLPRHYTELLISRLRQKKDSLRDFLDLLNHRLISLFYRAWEKYRFPIGYERAARRGDDSDSFSHSLFDLMGMGTGGLRGRLEIGDEAPLFYAGLLARRPHSGSVLKEILQDFFGAPVVVEQFVGQWLKILQADRTRIGERGANHRLGVSALAGKHVWDQQAKFRVRVGPLSFKTFLEFLPNGHRHRQLIQFTRFIAGQEFDFDVQLVLKANEVPDCGWLKPGQSTPQSGASRQVDPPPPPRLGWTTWLGTNKFTRDADDVVFSGGQTKIGAMPDERPVAGGDVW
jgi:type VI secretion system protein ImpH